MKIFKDRLILILTLTLVFFILGCASKYDHLTERKERGRKASLNISHALAEGKGVIITKDPRPALWLGVNTDSSFTLHQETPRVDGYAAFKVEPGTYAYAGGRVAMDAGKHGDFDDADAKVEDLGVVRTARTHKSRTWTEYAHRAVPASYTLGLGYATGPRYHRGYWGDRYYGRDASFLGASAHLPSYETRRVPVARHREVSPWMGTFTVILPNRGMDKKKNMPLVASITVGAGEVVVLDEVFIKDVEGESTRLLHKAEKGGGLANASLRGDEVLDETAYIEKISFGLIPHAPGLAPVLPPFGNQLREDRRINKGVWLQQKAEVEPSGLQIYTISK